MKKADYIKSLFREKKLKVKDVALRMNISSSTLSAKINGHRIFKEREIQILLEMLNMTYEEVFKTENVSIVDNDKEIVIVGKEKFAVSYPTAGQIIEIIKKEAM
jgi:transcriptional regulator with XRE-family HTH domain